MTKKKFLQHVRNWVWKLKGPWIKKQPRIKTGSHHGWQSFVGGSSENIFGTKRDLFLVCKVTLKRIQSHVACDWYSVQGNFWELKRKCHFTFILLLLLLLNLLIFPHSLFDQAWVRIITKCLLSLLHFKVKVNFKNFRKIWIYPLWVLLLFICKKTYA